MRCSTEHAAELHRQVHDVPGEAYDVQNLGEVYLRRAKLDEAEALSKNEAEALSKTALGTIKPEIIILS